MACVVCDGQRFYIVEAVLLLLVTLHRFKTSAITLKLMCQMAYKMDMLQICSNGQCNLLQLDLVQVNFFFFFLNGSPGGLGTFPDLVHSYCGLSIVFTCVLLLNLRSIYIQSIKL